MDCKEILNFSTSLCLFCMPCGYPRGGISHDNSRSLSVFFLAEFRARQTRVRPAIESMLDAAKAAARGEGEYSTYDESFETEG